MPLVIIALGMDIHANTKMSNTNFPDKSNFKKSGVHLIKKVQSAWGEPEKAPHWALIDVYVADIAYADCE